MQMLWLCDGPCIRKDYPTTGVLKPRTDGSAPLDPEQIRKDYPTTGVLKPHVVGKFGLGHEAHQEGLSDYWGIGMSAR